MNTIKVVAKTVVVKPAATLEVTEVKWRTMDDAFARRLTVVVNGVVPIVVAGAEYDALGQWTDDTVKELVFTRLGLTEANPEN